MNQGIPLSLGCTGNALSNQRSIDNEETTHPLKSMASGPLKNEKGTRPVLILATHRHTTGSVMRVCGAPLEQGFDVTGHFVQREEIKDNVLQIDVQQNV